jgi:hypothetical protein
VTTYDGTTVKLNPLRLDYVDSIHLSVPLKEKETSCQTGYSDADIVVSGYPVTLEALPTSVTTVEDKAGPVIRQAVYYPGSKESGIPRKIIVHFSEPVLWKQVETRPSDFLSLYRDGTNDTGAFSALPAIDVRSSRSAEIELTYDIAIAVLKDSISLRPEASDSRNHIADSTEWRNLPGKDNRRAPFMLADALIDIAAMAYDTNGQGYIDKIILAIPPEYTFSDPLAAVDSVISSIRLVPSVGGEERDLKCKGIVSTGFYNQLAIIIQEHTPPLSLETKWDKLTIELHQSFVSVEGIGFRVATVHDNAGPVIDNAVVHAAGIGAVNSFDTLTVVFSEPVDWLTESFYPDELFAFNTGDNSGARNAFHGLSSKSIIRLDSAGIAIIMENGFAFNRDLDSISIASTAQSMNVVMHDRSENPANVNNRKVNVSVDAKPDAVICPNPFIPGVSRDPFSGNTGTLLIAQCEESAREYDGKVTIFNALGNVIIERRKMTVHSSNDRWLTYLWNGMDATGSYVGCGVYAAKIDITKRMTGKKLQPVYKKIGVMRATK